MCGLNFDRIRACARSPGLMPGRATQGKALNYNRVAFLETTHVEIRSIKREDQCLIVQTTGFLEFLSSMQTEYFSLCSEHHVCQNTYIPRVPANARINQGSRKSLPPPLPKNFTIYFIHLILLFMYMFEINQLTRIYSTNKKYHPLHLHQNIIISSVV